MFIISTTIVNVFSNKIRVLLCFVFRIFYHFLEILKNLNKSKKLKNLKLIELLQKMSGGFAVINDTDMDVYVTYGLNHAALSKFNYFALGHKGLKHF